jgi:hypothetical protein
MPEPAEAPPPLAEFPDPKTIISESELRRPATQAAEAAAVLVTPTAVYRIVRTTQVDPKDTPLSDAERATAGMQRFAGEHFKGEKRKAAKLSVADGTTEDIADVVALIATLPKLDDMVHHHPPITNDASSGRVAEEKRNVRLRAFLWAASREADNDYHLIVGEDQGQPRTFITMEVSGLPPADNPTSATLQASRDAFKHFFGDQLPGASYDYYVPPIPIEVEGSLYFDMPHATDLKNRPGPKDLRPNMPVIWEVHPITSIVFEP